MQMMQRLGGHILPVSGRLAQLDTLCPNGAWLSLQTPLATFFFYILINKQCYRSNCLFENFWHLTVCRDNLRWSELRTHNETFVTGTVLILNWLDYQHAEFKVVFWFVSAVGLETRSGRAGPGFSFTGPGWAGPVFFCSLTGQAGPGITFFGPGLIFLARAGL